MRVGTRQPVPNSLVLCVHDRRTQGQDEEAKYDDVFSPKRNAEDRPISTDLAEDIYDDVVCPVKLSSTLWRDSEKFENEESAREDDGYYLSIPNAYSSVEADMDEMCDCEQGVYDDVGLPTEEQVNSLYAGSSTGSILGKESEWEDLEEPTTSPLRSAAKDNARLRSSESVQILSNKKKSGHKWSRRIRRSKVFRKTEKTLPVDDTMTYGQLRRSNR
nr:uncharacterized protein LOC117229776 [Megalopta genalis]